MPDKSAVHTEDLANTEYDANRRARAEQVSGAVPAAETTATEPVTDAGEAPDVGLAQKGTDEAAVVRRETEI